MAKKKRTPPARPSDILLGQLLQQCRLSKDWTALQLGKRIKETEQQIVKYENGTYVPIAKLEEMTEVMDARIPKKLIRKISSARQREKDAGEALGELEELYRAAFSDD